MNQELIEDEASRNPMSLAELTARMQEFLAGAYTAVLFELEGEPVAYALYRPEGDDGIHLRQFFVSRAHRRSGCPSGAIGQAAVATLIRDYFPPHSRVSVDVLIGNEPAMRFWEAAGFHRYSVTLERHATTSPAKGQGSLTTQDNSGRRDPARRDLTDREP